MYVNACSKIRGKKVWKAYHMLSRFFSWHFILRLMVFKVRIFWEGHTIWKNLPLKSWHHSVMSKGYLPNLLETAVLCQNFVFWVRDFKFWLLAYFLILFNCAKFQKDWTTFILDILQGSPLWIFGRLQKQNTSKGGPL